MAKNPELTGKEALLLILALVALVCGLAAFQLRSRSHAAVQRAHAVRERLVDVRTLAERYRQAGPDSITISADITEAHSSEYITDALRRNGISTEGIAFNNPQQTPGRYAKVTTEINLTGASLESLLTFLKEVREDRPQLTLLAADFNRDGSADRWRGSIMYVALIPATPRS